MDSAGPRLTSTPRLRSKSKSTTARNAFALKLKPPTGKGNGSGSKDDVNTDITGLDDDMNSTLSGSMNFKGVDADASAITTNSKTQGQAQTKQKSQRQRQNQAEDLGNWLVEKVVKKRVRKGRVEYLVKWQDFPSSDNTWEPVSHLSSCPQFIAAFEATVAKRNKRRTVGRTSVNNGSDSSSGSSSVPIIDSTTDDNTSNSEPVATITANESLLQSQPQTEPALPDDSSDSSFGFRTPIAAADSKTDGETEAGNKLIADTDAAAHIGAGNGYLQNGIKKRLAAPASTSFTSSSKKIKSSPITTKRTTNGRLNSSPSSNSISLKPHLAFADFDWDLNPAKEVIGVDRIKSTGELFYKVAWDRLVSDDKDEGSVSVSVTEVDFVPGAIVREKIPHLAIEFFGKIIHWIGSPCSSPNNSFSDQDQDREISCCSSSSMCSSSNSTTDRKSDRAIDVDGMEERIITSDLDFEVQVDADRNER